MPRQRAVEVLLSDEEREQLQVWARRRSSAQALAQRSRIVLAAAEGFKNTEIAAQLGIQRGMAAKCGRGLSVIGSMVWSMSPGPVGRGRSVMQVWRR